jgi:hypothetical protein
MPPAAGKSIEANASSGRRTIRHTSRLLTVSQRLGKIKEVVVLRLRTAHRPVLYQPLKRPFNDFKLLEFREFFWVLLSISPQPPSIESICPASVSKVKIDIDFALFNAASDSVELEFCTITQCPPLWKQVLMPPSQ